MHGVNWVEQPYHCIKKTSAPLQPAALESYPQIHPNQEFAQYISNRLQQKFWIMLGYTASQPIETCSDP